MNIEFFGKFEWKHLKNRGAALETVCHTYVAHIYFGERKTYTHTQSKCWCGPVVIRSAFIAYQTSVLCFLCVCLFCVADYIQISRKSCRVGHHRRPKIHTHTHTYAKWAMNERYGGNFMGIVKLYWNLKWLFWSLLLFFALSTFNEQRMKQINVWSLKKDNNNNNS